MKLTIVTALFMVLLSACSVQQFPVNTKTKPFQNGGRVWGERMQKRGKQPWKLAHKKSSDILIMGLNVKRSDTPKMVEELNATSYTIETKSNLIVCILTNGLVDYKVVKVIKRDN